MGQRGRHLGGVVSATTAGDGRVVLVTGGSRGIGLACARRLQARGDRVAVTYRSAPPATLGGEPGTPDLVAVPCDVRDPATVEAAFAAVEERLGAVEVLIANAGVTKDTLLLRMGEDAWDEVVDTNLSGVYRVVRRALGPMVRAHRGRIVLVSSVVAFLGSAGQVNYGAAKAGLVGLARSLAREVGSRSITVNVVAPGVIETDMIAGLPENERVRSSLNWLDGAVGPQRLAPTKWPEQWRSSHPMTPRT